MNKKYQENYVMENLSQKKGQNACRCKAFMPNLSLLLNLQVKWNFM